MTMLYPLGELMGTILKSNTCAITPVANYSQKDCRMLRIRYDKNLLHPMGVF
jgi:hypothetical protein